MHLKIFVEDAELKERYREHIKQHNEKLSQTEYYDAGFDLLIPQQARAQNYTIQTTVKLDHLVKCAAATQYAHKPSPFFLYPRSSISKTPFRMANSTGIIDAGYRGNLIAALDVTTYSPPNGPQSLLQSLPQPLLQNVERIVQICAPNLEPIYVRLVDTLEELGQPTQRGTGGFGSTG